MHHFSWNLRYPTCFILLVPQVIRFAATAPFTFLLVLRDVLAEIAVCPFLDMISQVLHHEGIEVRGVFTLVALQPGLRFRQYLLAP